MVRTSGEGYTQVSFFKAVALHNDHMFLIGWADNDMRTVVIAGEDSVWNMATAFGLWPECELHLNHFSFSPAAQSFH